MDHNPSEIPTGESSMRICIIGGGSAGLSAIQVIKDSKQYKSGLWSVDAYEARDDIGGVWLPAPPVGDPPLTPMYDALKTNLAHPIMAFTSMSFPPSTPLFPKASLVLAYLKEYARKFDLMRHVHLNISVESAVWTGFSWDIRLSTGQRMRFERLIVANGRNCKPNYPPIPGLDNWMSEKVVTHAVYYRAPSHVGDTVLVVGGGPSGYDISAAMQGHCKRLIWSASTPIPFPCSDKIEKQGKVVGFSTDNTRTVFFADGTQESRVDHVFLATGYHLHFPFLSSIEATIPSPVTLPPHIHNFGPHLFPLARELFPLATNFPPWSIAFLGLPLKTSPFPMTEAQMRAVVRVFAEPDALDPTLEVATIHKRYETLCRKLTCADSDAVMLQWVNYDGDEEFEYRDALNALAGYEGPEAKASRWNYEFAAQRISMKVEWEKLVNSAEADDWVKGVGEGGEQEWIELMRKVYMRAGNPVLPETSNSESVS